MKRYAPVVFVGLLLTVACSGPGGGPAVVLDVRHVSTARGAPRIDRVVDVGAAAVPGRGALKQSPSDGRAVVGEVLLLWGAGFGKQPRVSIDGRPAQVLAHLEGGGIALRVPAAVDPGTVELELESGTGTTRSTLKLWRLGLVVTAAGLQAVRVDARGGITPHGPLLREVRGQRAVLSPDGAVAYVAGARGGHVALWVVDLTGALPRVSSTEQFPGKRVVDLAAARSADRALLVTDSHMVFIDSGRPLAPAFYSPSPLPADLAAKGVLAAALSDDGGRCALLVADLNRVVLLDARRPGDVHVAAVANAVPGARLQVVRDLAFAPDGAVLVLASDSPRSMAGGYQPALLQRLQVSGADGAASVQLTPQKRWQLGSKASLPELVLGAGEPTPAGTAIAKGGAGRSWYMPAFPSDLLGAPTASAEGAAAPGRLLRLRPDRAQPETLAQGAWVPSGVAVAGKTQVYLGLAALPRGKQWQRVLIHGRAWGESSPGQTPLEALPSVPRQQGELELGQVLLQP